MKADTTHWLKEYWLPILVTVLLHGVLLVWLSSDFVGENKIQTRQPKTITATLVKRKEVKASPKPVKKPKTPKSTQSQKQKKAEQAAKRRAAEKERQARIARQKAEQAKKDKAKKEQARIAKQKAEAARLKKEQEAAAKAQREAQQRAQEKAQQRAREQALLDSIAEEEAEHQAYADEELAMSYMGAIQQEVERNWSRPPSARNGMEVLLEIQLVPNGSVVQVNVVESSGNPAFDRSAVAAVTKSERFPEVAELPNRVFEQYYRKFRLRFKPEDLRL